MINFYGGQKGENYVISQIFANREELKKDLALDENSPIGLNEIVMICYGEYSNAENSEYRQNLNIDNPSETDIENENNSFEYKMNYNSSLYQKVPNGNWIKSDVFAEDIEFGENGEIDGKKYAPINLYKYRFLTSSMGEIPKITLQTGAAVAAWETPEIIENEKSQLANPVFDLHLPKAPTIIGSNREEKDKNGNIIKHQGILINPEAIDKDNTEINPYTVITFSTITENNDQLIEKQDENNSNVSWIEYETQQEVILGVNYNQNNEPEAFNRIQNIRGPEGPPGRPPVLKDGKWYNWILNNNELILSDTGMNASFNIQGTFSSNKFKKDDIINNKTEPDSEYKKLLKKSNDIVIGVLTASDGAKDTYTVMYYLKEDKTIGSALFVKSSSDAYLEQGINTYAIEQRVLEQINTTNNIAGAKGYYYTEINVTTKQIRVSETRVNPPKVIKTENKLNPDTSFIISKDWVAGDGLSLVNDSKYDYLSHGNTAVISEINGDIITYNGELGFTTITDVGTPKIDDYTIYVPSKPDKGTVLIREGSVAFGDRTQSNGLYSFAEGRQTAARGSYAHAEGRQTIANYASHAEGYGTRAYGQVSHAEGQGTEARASFSHAEGDHTIAGSTTQHVQGRCNIIDTENKYAHIIGNGSSPTNRRNIHTIDWDGNSWFQGSIISRTYSVILSSNSWQKSQDKDGVDKYTQQIVLNNFNSHDKDWSVIVNPVYTKDMTKLELQNYQREYNRLSSGYILTETTQDKDEIIKFTVFDKPLQEDLTVMIKVV